MIWRKLADAVLKDVNWSHVGHMNWVMTWPPFNDPNSVTTNGVNFSISKQMWRETNGGWMNARRWPSMWEMMPTMTATMAKIDYKR